MEKLERTAIQTDICLGEPTIRGTRIMVSMLLNMLAGGKAVEDVVDAYPEVDREDVRQAMQYAAWVAGAAGG